MVGFRHSFIHDLQNKISSLESEKRKLQLQITELQRSKDDAVNALDIQKGEHKDVENDLKTRINELEEENKMIKKSFDDELSEEKSKQSEYINLIKRQSN